MLIASGGSPAFPKGITEGRRESLYSLRTLEDNREIFRRLEDGARRVVVVGDGMLAYEVGWAIKTFYPEKEVTFVFKHKYFF